MLGPGFIPPTKKNVSECGRSQCSHMLKKNTHKLHLSRKNHALTVVPQNQCERN